MADQLLNNETREFMKSIGLRDAANETDKAKGSKKNKNDSKNNNNNNKTKPEEKKKKFTEVVSPPSTPVERPTPLPAKKKAIPEKPKVKARKWGKGSKDVVDSQNSKDNKESKVGKDGKGFPNKSKHQNQSQNQNKDVMIIKGKPSTPELNWLHVKIDPNQQILSSFSDMKWYQVVASFDDVNFQDFKISKQSLETINSSVASLFSQEVAKYQKSKSLNGEEKWMNDVIRSGTLTDKIAALALRVQQSPPHELESLDLLISMALKKEQRTSQLALEALKDLLVHNLLPDRRLIPYALRPLGHSAMSLSVLLTFWYENELIKRIESIMNALEIGLKSTVDYFKMKCMEIVADWLSTKPEQENILLSFLVNKLGDPSSKVGSKCITLLSNVVYRHPAMKLVIIKEVRQLISRSNLIPRAVYSGVIFLSQIKLGVNENKVAVELVDCYVSLFEKAVTQDTLGSKLLAALLTGINRAFPFLVNKSSLNKHTDALFKIVHQSSFSSATQALTLISYLALGHQPEKSSKKGSTTAATTTTATTKANSEKNKNNTTVNEEEGEKEGGDLIARYYNSLYSKLLADEILTRSHNTLFFNLLFRSMKRDPSDVRVLSFCKRILINTTHATPPIAAGLIFLVSEVCRSRPTLIEKLITTLESTPTESSQTDESYFLLGNFDGSKRNPSYACQQNSSNAWELVLFKSHFNPSVKTFAKSFMDPTAKHTITYSGDPTVDFSITSFLNRFAYKNPKKQQLEQRRKRSQVLSEEPVNTRAFLESASEVAPEKVFFYKFFGERNKLIAEGRSRRKKRRSDEDDDDDDDRSDLGSDFDEQEIDRFADKLADELMENYAGKADIDDDDDDDGDDDGAFDDDAFGEDEDDDGADDFDENQGDDDEGEGEGEGDDDTPYLEGQGDGDDDDDDDGIHHFSEDFDEPPPSAAHKNKSSGGKDKNKKRKAGSNDDVFAAAEDFEDDMEANVAGVLGLSSSRGSSSESTPPPPASASKHANKSKKRSRKG